MEAVVRAVAKQRGLRIVRALIKVVAQLVVNGREIVSLLLDAHLDAQVFQVINVPGAGVANYVAIAWLGKHRAFPKCLRKRGKAQGHEEAFTVMHHSQRFDLLGFQNLC